MTFLKPGQLSRTQFFFLLIHSQTGLVVLTLPYVLGNETGHDGWITVLISALIVQLLAYFLFVILKKYPDKTLYDVTIEVFGTFLGKCLNIIIILYYLSASLYQAYHCTSILKLWYYYRTPFWALLLLFIIVGTYILMSDLQSIGQFMTLAIAVIIFMLLLLMFNLKSLNYQYLLPIGEEGILSILKASRSGTWAFSGFEVFLFLHPFVMTSQKKKMRTISASIWAVACLYLLATIIVFMYFPNASKNIANSVVYYIIPIHSTAIVRIEVFFICGYAVLMGTTFLTHMYVALTGLARFAKKKDHKRLVPATVILIYVSGLIVHHVAGRYAPLVFNITEYVYSFVFLLIAAVIATILYYRSRKEKGRSTNET